MQAVDVIGVPRGPARSARTSRSRRRSSPPSRSCPGDLPPPDKLKELIVFRVSEQYFALRKALGIAIG